MKKNKQVATNTAITVEKAKKYLNDFYEKQKSFVIG